MSEDPQSAQAIRINDRVAIPLAELRFQFTRSSGPGGQHVNRSETQVELLFDLVGSPSLTEGQKAAALSKLGSRVDSQGILHIAASGTRSQLRNREEATARFAAILNRALRVPLPRRPTTPTRASREQRLEEKRKRAGVKRQRHEVE